MSTKHPFRSASSRLAFVLPLLAASLLAQLAPAPVVDAATLARHDRNHNGRLDPDELAALEAERARTAPADLSLGAPAPAADETIVLSPFEVVADTKGYFAANTLSGTRLNTKLEDLASSIAVVTKEQMADFAMLDINDVFLYTASTEGIGTYTEFDAEDAQGAITDTVSGDPANANRIRGIGNANVSVGNFETSNRVPLDPIDADGVEISRGPNANIFGLGNASGTVNILRAAANLQRDRTQVTLRADSFDGWRASLDLNRVLARNMFAVRLSAVRQHDGFDLKPSGVDSERYNAMVQFRPFKRTTIGASYQVYRAGGNRPNSLPPLDGITDWRNAGSPTWDPPTNSMFLNGQFARTGTPAYLYTPANNFGQVFVDRQGIALWTASYGVSGTAPNTTTQDTRRLVVTRARVNDAQPLFGRRVEMVGDKELYDWSSINIAAPNRFWDRTETARVTFDQGLFETRRQSLAVQLAWFREDSERDTRYVIGDGQTSGPTGQLVVDVNERLYDGRPNPFFLRPLLALTDPRPSKSPLRSDTYRAQLAWKLDFTGDDGWRRWLGAHSLVGYGDHKVRVQRTYRFWEAIVSDNPWIHNAQGVRITGVPVRPYYRFYVGDNQGGNIDYEPAGVSYGNYTYIWGNVLTGALRADPITLGEMPNGAASGSRAVQKTQGGILQSRFWRGRIVTTFGKRQDRHYTKSQNLSQLTNDGLSYDYDFMNHWQPGDWQARSGRTEQRGVVVKPFRGFAALDRRASEGGLVTRLFADVVRGLSFHYNRSDSFKPAPPAQNVFGEWLPDPGGRGKDYGFALNVLDERLVIRVNKYETKQINSRSGASAGFAKALWNFDYNTQAFGLQQEITEWLTAAADAQGRTLSQAELDRELERIMGVPPRNRSEVENTPTSETDDIVGRGHEVEIHFNPSRHWTLHLNFTEQQTINSRLAPNVSIYAEQRLPYWTTIVDPRTNSLWWNTIYSAVETPFQQYRRLVANPLQVAKATEGLARPQVRRYRGNLTTNFRLSALTSQRLLARCNVGGAARYESKGAIGYYGLQQLPAVITDYDYRRPIWDKEHWYFDAFVGYRTRMWRDKIGAVFQLNARNLHESGRLQPIAAFPDGSPNSFRIVSPRQFILSAAFDL